MNSMSTQGPSGQLLQGGSAGNFKERRPSGYKKFGLQTYTPDQVGLHQQLFEHASPSSYLSKLAGGDQSFFDQIEAPDLRQFDQLMSQNASRFSNAGMGARRGSGFQNSTNQITSNFAQDLASRRSDMRRQAILDLMGFSSQLLGQRPYEQGYVKKPNQSSGFGNFAGSILGGLGGFLTGGPSGALSGAQIGQQAFSGF